jgi:hypothetical protein
LLGRRDRCEEAIAELERGLVLARRIGERFWEQYLLGELTWSLTLTGRWRESLASFAQATSEDIAAGPITFLVALPEPLVAQGKADQAAELMSAHARWEDSPDLQERTAFRAAQSTDLRAQGRNGDALAAAKDVLDATDELGHTSQAFKVALPQALEAALALGEQETAEDLLSRVEALPTGRLPPSIRAHASRYRARLSIARQDDAAAMSHFAAAEATFREFGMPFWLAATLTEHAEYLAAMGHPDHAPMLAEAAEIFERLEAEPWLRRASADHSGGDPPYPPSKRSASSTMGA